MALNENSPKCKFTYTCAAGATDVVRRNTFKDSPGGNIRIAAEHDIITTVGHLLQSPLAGYVEVAQHLVEFLILPGITFEHQLDVHSPTWSIRVQWLSALWAALLNAGMDTGRLESIEIFRTRVQNGLGMLTAAETTLKMANVLMNPNAEETWWHHVSPRRLRAGDATNIVFSQMRTIVTGHWAPDSQDAYPFESALDMLVPTQFTTRSASAQAAGVIAHLRRTVVRPGLDTYISVECANDEVGRRLQDTPEAAFIPLFERSWRTAFPELRTMLPACTDPQEVVLIVKSLLPRTNIQSDFTDATVVAFCKVIKPHLPNVANAATTRDGQDARVEQLMSSVRTEISMPGTAGSRKEIEADQLVALYKRPDFQDLNTALEGLQTLPLDGKAVVQEMLSAASAAGWLQLAGTTVPQKAFRTVRGLSADKGINTIHEYFNSALARNADGTPIEGAGTLVSEKVARNTINGNLANGSAKDQIDFWNDVALPVVVLRDGRDAVADLHPMANPADFFLDPVRMELALDALTAWFAAFGYGGKSTGSLNATLRNIIKSAKVLARMRDSELRKPGIVAIFRDAANSIFAEFSTALKAMLAGPIGSAVRPVAVMLPNTTAAGAWTAAISNIAAIVEEHKQMDVGLGRFETPPPRGRGSHVTALSHVTSHTRTLLGLGTSVGTDDSVSQFDTPNTGVAFGWGHLSLRYGVFEAGADIAFGHHLCAYTSQLQLPTGTFCWAPYAHEQSNERRSSWCTTPKVCKAHTDHARPDGLTDDMITSSVIDGGKPDPKWKILYKGSAKRPRDGDGAGKGKGKGKGKGRGAGKGRGGKGRGRGFGRQQ